MTAPSAKPAHTELPWKVGGAFILPENGDYVICRLHDTGKAKEDSELIIRAVNSHQALVDTLTRLVRADPFVDADEFDAAQNQARGILSDLRSATQ